MTASELHVVLGAGPVGLAVAAELARRNHHVRVINRGGRAAVADGVETVAADILDADAARAACSGASVIYNCLNAPYNRWTELLPPLQAAAIHAAAAAGTKLVVMDNVYMYGPTGGLPLNEDHPFAATTRKGHVRAAMAEDLLAAHRDGRVRVAIGRASDFFGPQALLSAMGERTIVPAINGKPVRVLGDPDLPHTYTYVPDIGRALVTLGEDDRALGKAWHLPSPETVTTRQFVEMIAAAAGQAARISRTPGFVLAAVGLFDPNVRELREMLYEFEEPFVVDSSRFEQTFDIHATPLPKAIEATVRWFQSRTSA